MPFGELGQIWIDVGRGPQGEAKSLLRFPVSSQSVRMQASTSAAIKARLMNTQAAPFQFGLS